MFALAVIATAAYDLVVRAIRSANSNGRARLRASAIHALIALVLSFYYFPVVRALPGEIVARTGAAWVLAPLMALAYAGFVFVLDRTPRRVQTGFFTFALSGALAVASVEAAVRRAPQSVSSAEFDSTLPNVYYIVLDGYSGLAAFPSAVPYARRLRDRLAADHSDRGFAVFRGAYSSTYETARSIYSVLDGTLHEEPPLTSPGHHLMPKVRLFDDVIAAGYRPMIYQSDALDFAPPPVRATRAAWSIPSTTSERRCRPGSPTHSSLQASRAG